MNTPRTDAEHAKTLTPAYEHVGAEQEAWNWARKLEKELQELNRLMLDMGRAMTVDYSKPFSDLF